jgi:hypothetical protein
VDVEADLLIALRRIAGVAAGSDFTIRDGDVSFRVEYVGGSSSHLTLRAPYDAVARAEVVPGTRAARYRASARGGVLTAIRPMAIVLRAENAADRMAKTEGVSREHQTGDDAFDQAVYIDSPTTDEAVLAALLNDAVRGAASKLLSLGFDSVTLDDGERQVTAVISGFRHLRNAEEPASLIVNAFATLLRGLPPVRAGDGAHPARSRLPAIAAVAGLIAALVVGPIGFFVVAGSHGCTEPAADGEGVSLKDGCGGTELIALVAALVAGMIAFSAARAVARPRMSGHSDSHGRIFCVSMAAFAWVALATFLASAVIGYAGR